MRIRNLLLIAGIAISSAVALGIFSAASAEEPTTVYNARNYALFKDLAREMTTCLGAQSGAKVSASQVDGNTFFSKSSVKDTWAELNIEGRKDDHGVNCNQVLGNFAGTYKLTGRKDFICNVTGYGVSVPMAPVPGAYGLMKPVTQTTQPCNTYQGESVINGTPAFRSVQCEAVVAFGNASLPSSPGINSPSNLNPSAQDAVCYMTENLLSKQNPATCTLDSSSRDNSQALEIRLNTTYSCSHGIKSQASTKTSCTIPVKNDLGYINKPNATYTQSCLLMEMLIPLNIPTATVGPVLPLDATGYLNTLLRSAYNSKISDKQKSPNAYDLTPTSAEQYYIDFEIFKGACKATKNPSGDKLGNRYTIAEIDADGNIKTNQWAPAGQTKTYGEKIYRFRGSIEETTCQSVAEKIDSADDAEVVAAAKIIRLAHDQGMDLDGNATNISNADEDDPDKGEQQNCLNTGGFMAWIMCPVISAVGGIGSTMYGWIKGSLELDSGLFATGSGGNNGAYGAWSVFRDMANTLLVIVFLVIIISQLTGLGVSNYGIKKMLPRILVVAVLINISFIICQLSVDLSNILGSSLESFLGGLVSYTGGGNQTTIGTVLSGAGSVMVTIGIFGTIAAFAAFGGANLIGLLLMMVIIIVIAVVMLFVLLAIRQAGVILLVAIAPLAMACFILPNTESLFKKWLKIFTALLVLYPLCGMAVGAGDMAGTIIANTKQGGWMGLIGFLLPVIPYFFVPTLLKSSLAGLNNVGAKLSALGSKGSGVLGGKAKESHLAKNASLGMSTGITNSRFGKSKLGQMLSTPGSRAKLAGAINSKQTADLQDLANKRAIAMPAGQRTELVKAAQEKQDVSDFMDINRNASTEDLQKILTKELNAGKSVNAAAMRGAMSMLAGRGGQGVEAIRGVAGSATTASSESVQAFKNAAMEGPNLKAIKEKSASLFNHIASDPMIDESGKSTQIQPGDFKQLTNEEFAASGDAEIDRLRKAAQAAGADETNKFNTKVQEVINSGSLRDKVSNDKMWAAMGDPPRDTLNIQHPPTPQA
jgi:hypothetical protein